MEKAGSFYGRWFHFVLRGLLLISGLFVLCAGFCQIERSQYNRDSERMGQLGTFFEQLSQLNDSVYTYAQTGQEDVYAQIMAQMNQARALLRDLTQVNTRRDLYRRLRDLQEMFVSYTECVNRIYEHAYLCDVLTVSGKRVLNRYYTETADIYESMTAQFQGLYTRILQENQVRKTRMDQRNNLYIAYLIFLMSVTIVMMALEVRTMFRRMVRPIGLLTESAASINLAGPQQEPPALVASDEQSDDQIRGLVEVYNQMLVRIQSQVDQIRENARTRELLKNEELENLRVNNLLKTSQLQALQMQINPHYLFNTMNMLSQTAFLEGADQTKELLDKAAGLFRYTLDYSAKEVPLSRELEILGDYIDLQESRFGDRIAFVFDLDESFHQVMVPGMILQPLVENALVHGVGMKTEDAVVTIRTYRIGGDGQTSDPDLGVIEVRDNGEGMDGRHLEQVRRAMYSEAITSEKIGLANVCQRLKMTLGEKADMRIDSHEGAGTCVTIRIRLSDISQNRKERNTYEPYIDRG